MTQISIALAVDAPDGREGVPGVLEATPQRIRTDGATVVIPNPVSYPITATGTTVVELDSPGPEWSWHLKLSRKGGTVPTGFTRLVSPYSTMDTDFGSVDFEDGVAVVADGHPLIAVFRANGYGVDDGTSQTLVIERDVVFGLAPITWGDLVDIDPASRLPTAQPAKGLTPLILDAIAEFSQGDPAVQVAAVAAVQAAIVGKQLVPGVQIVEDAFTVSFDDGVLLLRVTEQGLTTPIVHRPKSITADALSLPADSKLSVLPSGYAWGIAFEDPTTGEQRLQFGVKDDGSLYPPVSAQYGVPAFTGPTIRWDGDSLTAGAGGNGTSAVSVFSALAGRTVLNYGGGGETSADIGGRDGANPLLAKFDGNTIPASGAVLFDIIRSDGKADTKTLSRQGSIGLNPVTVGGVVGSVSFDTTANRFKFTRTTAGTAVTLLRPAALLPNATAGRRTDSLILQLGRNNLTDTDRIMEDTDAIIANAQAAYVHYLVVGVLNGAGEGTGTQAHTAILALEARQRNRYGRRFVNLRRHLIDYGLAEAGITPTTQDLADIAADIVPTSLRFDNIHLNAAGYTVDGRFVHERAREIGMV